MSVTLMRGRTSPPFSLVLMRLCLKYRGRAIHLGAAGAFNLAAEPVLHPQTIAHAIGASRSIPFSARAARFLVGLTWRLRLQSTDPGWVDIAVTVPLMSTERARDVLGWIPEIPATDALKEVVDGVGQHARLTASPPLRGKTT
ncbi:MAG: epimerase [Subtercola sp.]|nr:epimerase [Subtercola sp.]